MKTVYLLTRQGPSFVSINDVFPVVTPDGKKKEKYVGELSPNDIIDHESDYAKLTFEDVLQDLIKDPDYIELRNFCYEGNTPKLKRYLLEGFAVSYPQFFSDEERGSIGSYITGERELSDDTKQKVIDEIYTILSRHNITHLVNGQQRYYSIETFNDWLDGRVVYPEDPFAAPIIAASLRYGEMFDWANIASHEDKDNNPYQLFVTVHRTTPSMLAPRKDSEGYKPSDTDSKSSKRVFSKLPEIHKRVVERLKHRLEHGVRGTEVLEVRILEGKRSYFEGMSQTGTGLEKKPIAYKNASEREPLYERIGRKAPVSRADRLKNSLQQSFVVADEILDTILEIYRSMFDEIILSSANAVGKPVINIQSPSDVFATFSPIYQYSTGVRLDIFRRYYESIRDLSKKSKDERKAIIRDFRKTIPETDILYPAYSGIYDSSILLKYLYNKQEFLRLVTQVSRDVDVQDMGNLLGLFDEGRDLAYVVKKCRDSTNTWKVTEGLDGNANIEELRGKLMDIESEIPQEITMFRTLRQLVQREVSEHLGQTQPSYLFDEEVIFNRVCEGYGIDGGLFRNPFANQVTRSMDVVRSLTDSYVARSPNSTLIDITR